MTCTLVDDKEKDC
jgi:hypothetical protein